MYQVTFACPISDVLVLSQNVRSTTVHPTATACSSAPTFTLHRTYCLCLPSAPLSIDQFPQDRSSLNAGQPPLGEQWQGWGRCLVTKRDRLDNRIGIRWHSFHAERG